MSLTLEEMEARIPAWYMSANEEGGPSFHVESAPGRGKSSLLSSAARILKRADPEGNYGFAYINGASTTLAWLCGFQQLLSTRGSNGDKSERLRSVFSLPFWWFTKEGKALDEYDGGIILVDEKDKMGVEEKKLVADMRLEKRVANHLLPPGWVVWTAGNRAKDRSGSTKELDFEINRCIILEVRDSTSSWVQWCRSHKVTPEVINFGETHSEILFMDAPKVQGPYCTPRSLVQADTHLRSCMTVFGTDKIPLDTSTETEIAGGIGKPAAEQLFLDIRMGQELPSYDDCVQMPMNINIPQEPDKMRLMAYKMADQAKIKDTPEIMKFMGRFPKEFQTIFVRMARERNSFIIAQPAVREWCSGNAALIALITNYQNVQR